jgi:hypothetical protein
MLLVAFNFGLNNLEYNIKEKINISCDIELIKADI